MQDTIRRWRFHALQRWKKDRPRRMPSAATTKSWPTQANPASQNVRRHNHTSYGFLWAVRCGREPILSVEDRVLFRKKSSSGKMCGNHRGFLICQEEEKVLERLSLKRCMFRTPNVAAEAPEKHPHSWGGLCQRTVGKQAKVDLLRRRAQTLFNFNRIYPNSPNGGEGGRGAWGGGGGRGWAEILRDAKIAYSQAFEPWKS